MTTIYGNKTALGGYSWAASTVLVENVLRLVEPNLKRQLSVKVKPSRGRSQFRDPAFVWRPLMRLSVYLDSSQYFHDFLHNEMASSVSEQTQHVNNAH
jgi:hypothetical protein